MSGLFNTVTGATLFDHNSVTGGANDVEVNIIKVDDYILFPDGTTQDTANSSTSSTFTNLTVTNTATINTLNVSGNMQFGNALTDQMAVVCAPTYYYGSRAQILYTALAQNIPALTIAPLVVNVPNYYRQIKVHLFEMSTSATTLRPHIVLTGSSASTRLNGATATNGGGSSNVIPWATDEIYLWGETWDGSYITSGEITFTRMGTIGSSYTLWSITVMMSNALKVSYGAGTMYSAGVGTVTVNLHAGTGATFDNGQYNVTYI